MGPGALVVVAAAQNKHKLHDQTLTTNRMWRDGKMTVDTETFILFTRHAQFAEKGTHNPVPVSHPTQLKNNITYDNSANMCNFEIEYGVVGYGSTSSLGMRACQERLRLHHTLP